MFATSGDILNLSLAFGFLLLVIFLCILIFYAIVVLRDVSKVTDEIEEIVSKVHRAVIQPLRAIDFIMENVTPYIEAIISKKFKSKK